MAEKTEIIYNILEHGIDLKNRRIYFGSLSATHDNNGSEFSWLSVERVIRAIHIMESEAHNKPIELHMSSPGGDPHALMRLHDVIVACSCQIKFIGSGEICSAATWIMACCDERHLYSNTRILIHDSSAGDTQEVPSKLTDRYINDNEEKYVQHTLNKIYADNSRMPLEFWDEMTKRDLWLSAEEAIILGLADKIIQPKKRGNLRRVRIASLKTEPNGKEFNKLLRKLKERVYMDKNFKLELHVPQEQFDKNIDVDDTPIVDDPIDLPPID